MTDQKTRAGFAIGACALVLGLGTRLRFPDRDAAGDLASACQDLVADLRGPGRVECVLRGGQWKGNGAVVCGPYDLPILVLLTECWIVPSAIEWDIPGEGGWLLVRFGKHDSMWHLRSGPLIWYDSVVTSRAHSDIVVRAWRPPPGEAVNEQQVWVSVELGIN